MPGNMSYHIPKHQFYHIPKEKRRVSFMMHAHMFHYYQKKNYQR